MSAVVAPSSLLILNSAVRIMKPVRFFFHSSNSFFSLRASQSSSLKVVVVVVLVLVLVVVVVIFCKNL